MNWLSASVLALFSFGLWGLFTKLAVFVDEDWNERFVGTLITSPTFKRLLPFKVIMSFGFTSYNLPKE